MAKSNPSALIPNLTIAIKSAVSAFIRSVTAVPDDLWRKTGALYATPTGLTITPDNAMGVNAWFSAIRFMSFMLASLPWIVYQKNKDDRQRATDHPLYALLHDIPNPDMTSFDLTSTLMSHVMARGNGFAEIEIGSRGEVKYLWPLRPDRMEMARNETNELRYLYTLPESFGGERRVLRPEQVFHLRGLSSNGLWGYSVVTLLRNSIALSKAAEEFGSSYFGNNAEPGVVLRHPGTLSTAAYTRIKSSWEQAHMGLSNAHRAAIVEEGMEVEKIGFSARDSEFIETRKFQIYEISRATGVPPHLLFELTHATFSNIEHQSLEFVIYHLRPWLVSFEKQANRSLLLERERKAGYYTEFLVDAIVRGDINTRFSSYASGWEHGIYSINDILRMENRNTIGEAGDQRFVPLNFAPVGKDGLPIQSQPQADPVKNPNTPARSVALSGASSASDERRRSADVDIRPILGDVADRITRRENNEWNDAQKRFKQKPEKLTAWIEQFYKRDYPEFINTVIAPLVGSGLINEERAQEFIKTYCDQRGLAALEPEPLTFDLEHIASQLAGATNG